MTRQLTLTIDQQVIETAKKYAQTKGRNLSNLVENYLRALSACEDPEDDISPRVKRLIGSVELPENIDCKQSLGNAIFKKHGKGPDLANHFQCA